MGEKEGEGGRWVGKMGGEVGAGCGVKGCRAEGGMQPRRGRE